MHKGFKVRSLHKHFLTQFLGHEENRTNVSVRNTIVSDIRKTTFHLLSLHHLNSVEILLELLWHLKVQPQLHFKGVPGTQAMTRGRGGGVSQST